MGSITETATSAPGNSSVRPNTKAPLAMTLKLNGYSTAQFGKCHEVPVGQSSPMGPSVGWAWAMDAPFQWTKQVASHLGGTRNGAVVHWPAGFAERGGQRSQFTHVIDGAPTISEAAGLPEPTVVNGPG